MTPLTLTLTTGKDLSLEADSGEVLEAMTSQQAAFMVVDAETGQRTVINMRHVAVLSYTVPPVPVPAPSNEAAAEVADQNDQGGDQRTIAQLKEALDAAKVDSSSAKVRDDYLKLAQDNHV